MASNAHDMLVQALRDEPELLRSLLEKVTGQVLTGPWEPVDSTVRFTRSEEFRPDIVAKSGKNGVACEVQNQPDDVKARKWPLVVSALYNESQQMGELIVITASAAVGTTKPPKVSWIPSPQSFRGVPCGRCGTVVAPPPTGLSSARSL